jgi:hypothetical protein
LLVRNGRELLPLRGLLVKNAKLGEWASPGAFHFLAYATGSVLLRHLRQKLPGLALGPRHRRIIEHCLELVVGNGGEFRLFS